jgi:hypothetical protein
MPLVPGEMASSPLIQCGWKSIVEADTTNAWSYLSGKGREAVDAQHTGWLVMQRPERPSEAGRLRLHVFAEVAQIGFEPAKGSLQGGGFGS